MLTFTEYMKRINQLAEQSLVHVQSENYDTTRDDLLKIWANCDNAVKQLDEMVKAKK